MSRPKIPMPLGEPGNLHKMGLLDRGARPAVLTLILFSAVQSVWAARGLFADGGAYMWTVLSTESFFTYPSRVVAQVFTQFPLVAAIALGVDDVGVLARLQSFGTAAIPVLLWGLALAAVVRQRMFWPMVVIFAVTFFNSGFMSVGEYNLAYSLVALSFVLLVRKGRLTRAARVGLIFSALLMLFCYESVAVLAPLLGLLLVIRMRWGSSDHGAPRLSTRVFLWILLSLYAAATVVGVLNILSPRDAQNFAGASDFLTPLMLDRQLAISAVAGLLALFGQYFLPARFRWLGAGAAIFAAGWILLQPAVWAHPWMHFVARTAVGIAMFLMLAMVAIGEWRESKRPEQQSAVPQLVGGVAIFFALFWPLTVGTASYAQWLAEFDGKVSKAGDPVLIEESGLDQSLTADYGWTWTNPHLSQVLGGGLVVLSPGDSLDSPPALPAPILDRFANDAPLF